MPGPEHELSNTHAKHSANVVSSLQSSVPEPEPVPQSDGHETGSSPVSHTPLPQIGCVPEPLPQSDEHVTEVSPTSHTPLPQTAPCDCCMPQSDSQLLTSLESQMPSPHATVYASGVPPPPPLLLPHDTTKAVASAHASAIDILIMERIVLTGKTRSIAK